MARGVARAIREDRVMARRIALTRGLLHQPNRARFVQLDFGRAFEDHHFARQQNFAAFKRGQIGKLGEIGGFDGADQGGFVIFGEVEQHDAVAFGRVNLGNGAQNQNVFADHFAGGGQVGGGQRALHGGALNNGKRAFGGELGLRGALGFGRFGRLFRRGLNGEFVGKFLRVGRNDGEQSAQKNELRFHATAQFNRRRLTGCYDKPLFQTMPSLETKAAQLVAFIVAYAIRIGAHRVRVLGFSDEKVAVRVLYQDYDENWQERMKLPEFARVPLFQELENLAQRKEAHDFELPLSPFGLVLRWHLEFDFSPDEKGNQSALIHLINPDSEGAEMLD